MFLLILTAAKSCNCSVVWRYSATTQLVAVFIRFCSPQPYGNTSRRSRLGGDITFPGNYKLCIQEYVFLLCNNTYVVRYSKVLGSSFNSINR